MKPDRKPPIDAAAIEAVRRFNRFYTQRIGALQEGLLHTDFSLQEARVIYELQHQAPINPSALAARLDLDAGYLSRIVRRLESRRLVERVSSEEDRRQSFVALSSEGKKAFRTLDKSARSEIAGLLGDLTEEDRGSLLKAMHTIQQMLDSPAGDRVPYILRGPVAGDLGWVVHRHGVLYNQEYKWDERFEALVAEIMAQFVKTFDARRERCWIAERESEFAGCVFVVRHPQEPTTAKLRCLLVEPRARGLGIGRRLVQECSRFARQAGYKKIVLWTNSVLVSARRIYEVEGYRLMKEEAHHSFGHDLVGQLWELDL